MTDTSIVDFLRQLWAKLVDFKDELGLLAALIAIGGLLFAMRRRLAAMITNVPTLLARQARRRAPAITTRGLRRREWTVVYGREVELRKLRVFLDSDDTVCVVSGIGGTGKTTLVTEFCHRLIRGRDEEFRAIIFVTADKTGRRDSSDRTVDAIARTVAILLDQPELQRHAGQELRAAVGRLLDRVGPSLVVIDNLDTVLPAEVFSGLHALGVQTKFIVTTRSGGAAAARLIPLGDLTFENARQLVDEYVERYWEAYEEPRPEKPSPELLDRLIEACGRNPLALLLVIPSVCDASNMADAGIHPLITNTTYEGVELVKHIAQVTCDELASDQESILPLEVLAALPDPLTKDALFDICSTVAGVQISLPKLLRRRILEMHQAEDSIGASPRYSIHPLVREHLRAGLGQRDQRLKRILLAATEFYLRFLRETIGNPREEHPHVPDYRRAESEIRNILFLLDANVDAQPKQAIQMLVELGYFFRVREYWEEADRFWNLGATLAAQSAIAPPETQLRFSMYTVYMDIFGGRTGELADRAHGFLPTLLHRLPRARALCRRDGMRAISQSGQQTVYNTASLLRLLGLIAKELRQYPQALRFLRESYRMMIRIDSGPGIARTANDLADLLLASQPAEADRLIRQATRRSQAARDSIETLRSQRLRGDYYAARGERRRAERRYRKAWELSQELGLPDERFCISHGLESVGVVHPSSAASKPVERAEQLNFAALATWLDNRPRDLQGRIVRCVILDWSGVIANDLEVTWKCQAEVLQEFSGKTPFWHRWTRLAVADWTAFFSEQIGENRLEQAKRRYRRLMAGSVGRIGLLPGVEATLQELKKRGYVIALYSGQVSNVVENILARTKLGKYLDYVLIPEKGCGKPAREHIQRICDELMVDPSEVVLVDDMEAPISLARAMGVFTVGHSSLLNQDLRSAHRRIARLKNLEGVLSELDECRVRMRDFYEQRYARKRAVAIARVLWCRVVDNLYYCRLLERQLASHRAALVLDVGSGPALYRAYWRKTIPIDVARKAFWDEAGVVADASLLPLADGAADGALCIETLEHLCPGQDLGALKEIRRVLAPGGIVVVSVPRRPTGISWLLRKTEYLWAESGHLREYTPQGLEALVRSAGFEIVQLGSSGYLGLASLLYLERRPRLAGLEQRLQLPASARKALVSCGAGLLRFENVLFCRLFCGFRLTVVATPRSKGGLTSRP